MPAKEATFVCSIHSDVHDNHGWLRCWNGCDDGRIDLHEFDSTYFDPGDTEECDVCRGAGGWRVCGICNADNEDVEW